MKKKEKKSQDFKTILDSLPGSVYWKDTNGVYLGCNQFVADMAGLASPSDIIGKTDAELVWKTHAELFRKNDIEVMRTGQPIQVEEPLLMANGETIVFQTTKSPLKDSQGHIIGIVGTSVDITLRKQKEEKTELYLQNVVSCMPGSIYWKDKKGVYCGCNQFVADMAGVKSPLEVIGKTDRDFPWKANYDIYRTNDEEVIRTGQSCTMEEPIILFDGRRRIYLNTKSPLLDKNGDIVGIIGIAFDITERKKAELENQDLKDEIEQTNNLMRRFMYVMSLRVRNELTSVKSAYEILNREELPQDQSLTLKLMDNAADKIINLFEHSTDFFNFDKSQIEEFSLQEMAAIVERNYLSLIDKKPILLLVNYDRKLPFYQSADKETILRTLKDLVLNAINYTELGYIKIDIALESQIGLEMVLKITISDTGCGISADKLEGIFNTFEQDFEKTPYRSGGFILSLAKKSLEKLGGVIDVSSEIDVGSIFTITVPVDCIKKQKTVPAYPEESIKPIILSNNPFFTEVIEIFTPIKSPQIYTEDRLKEEKESIHFQGYDFVFIDDQVTTTSVKLFLEKTVKKQLNTKTFVCLVGISKQNQVLSSLLPPNWCVRHLDLPLTPMSFSQQLIEEYGKWRQGMISESNYGLEIPKLKIFLVEDNPTACRLLKMLFEGEECDVEAFRAAEPLIKKIEQDQWSQCDMVFLDIELPGISGLDLAKYLRQHPAYKNIIIVAQTAHSSSEDKERYISVGINDMLSKPVTIGALRAILKRYRK